MLRTIGRLIVFCSLVITFVGCSSTDPIPPVTYDGSTSPDAERASDARDARARDDATDANAQPSDGGEAGDAHSQGPDGAEAGDSNAIDSSANGGHPNDAGLDAIDGSIPCSTVDPNGLGLFVHSLAELQAFEGCRTITGSLWIEGDALSDLSPLHALEQLTGNLRIYASLASLHGLEGLVTVGAGLTIASSSISDLDALSSLKTIGGDFVVDKATSLATIRLPKLTRVSSISIQRGPSTPSDPPSALAQIDLASLESTGDVSIGGQEALSRIEFRALTQAGTIWISAAPQLTTLLVPALTTVGALDLYNLGLTSLSLADLSKVDRIYISNAPITQIEGTGALTRIDGHLSLINCPLLTSIEAFRNVTSTGGLSIEDVALTSLEGLRSLTAVSANPSPAYDMAELRDLHSIKDLSGLRNLTTVAGNLALTNLPLTDLHGLEKLQSVGKKASLTWNQKLVHLTGLESLRSIGESIEVGNNASLVSLSSLNAVTALGAAATGTVYGIDIHDNGALQRIDGLRSLVRTGTYIALRIANEPALVAVDGFDVLESVGSISMTAASPVTLKAFGAMTRVTRSVELDTSATQSLNELAKLTSVGWDFKLTGAGPTSLSGLGSLTEVGGSLILGKLAITTDAELASLHNVGGTLEISFCPNLLHVNALPNLTSVGALRIDDNAMLPQCDADALLSGLQAAGFQGMATLSNNGGTGACN